MPKHNVTSVEAIAFLTQLAKWFLIATTQLELAGSKDPPTDQFTSTIMCKRNDDRIINSVEEDSSLPWP